MNRRLYFTFPNVEIAREVVKDLLLARIDERHMHFLGKRGIDLKDLPEATTSQKTDLIHGIQVGLLSGALTGLVVGLLVFFLQDFIGAKLQLGVVLVFFLVGGFFGALISGFLIGASTPNVRLKNFQGAMNQGQILLMADVPKERVDEIREIILKHHPEAEDHGIEPSIPAFP